MKKIIFILMITFFAGIAVSRQIELEFKLSDPKIERISNTDFYLVNQSGGLSSSALGEPALPWQPLKVLLPAGEIAVSVQIELSGESIIELEGFLYPTQAVQPVSQLDSADFFIKKHAYRGKIEQPLQQTGNLKTETWHGYNILLSSFCPLSYSPIKNELRHYTQAKITIDTQSGKAHESGKTVKDYSPAKAKIIADYVQNPEMLRLYPLQNRRHQDYDLLVIASEEFIPELEALQDFYVQYARRTEFVSTQYIETNIAGQDLAEQIRNYVIDEYSEYGISSLLLAGDIEHIPARGFWCQVQSSEIYEDDNIPADLYYSALDGSWNDDSDALWGEPEEDDLLPEVAVARLPFSSQFELTNMINKLLLYAQFPVVNDLDKPLLAAELLWYDPLTWGADYLDLLVGWQDDNGYITNGIFEDDNIQYLNERDGGDWILQDFLDIINAGTSFIHHSGHSSYNYMIKMHTEDVIEDNFASLNGLDHLNPLIYTHGCNCGGFDQDDCIAETALALPDFIAGFVGNSRYGWFNEGQTEGPSQHLHREFVNALYDLKINDIARTHLFSKAASAPWVTAPGQHEEGALRWCFYDCNVLADPVLPVWTAQPVGVTVNYPNQINVNSAEFTVYIEHMHTSQPAREFRCGVIYQEELIAVAITDSMGICNPEFETELTPGEELTLTISGYNCLPQQYYISISASQTDQNDIPLNHSDLKNFPNPFNPETEISFHLDQEARVILTIYTIKGQLLTTLLNKELPAGDHSVKWNSTDVEGKPVNSGIYLARLRTGNISNETKMLLLK